MEYLIADVLFANAVNKLVFLVLGIASCELGAVGRAGGCPPKFRPVSWGLSLLRCWGCVSSVRSWDKSSVGPGG